MGHIFIMVKCRILTYAAAPHVIPDQSLHIPAEDIEDMHTIFFIFERSHFEIFEKSPDFFAYFKENFIR